MIKAAFFLATATRRDSTPTVLTAFLGVTTNGTSCSAAGVASSAKANALLQTIAPTAVDFPVVTYAHYACVADCADAMVDAWEDTAGCAQAICQHEILLK